MRILVAHFRPDIVSGAERAIADMVERRSQGIEYVMLTPGEGCLADAYRRQGFTVWVRRIQTSRRLFPGLHSAQSLWFARRLRCLGFDAVLCNTFPAASRVGTACRLAWIPHGICVREYIRDTPRHRCLLARAGMVLAASQDVAGYLHGITDPGRIVVSRDFLDTRPICRQVEAHRSGGTRLLPFGPEHPVVGFIGRITAYKQPDLFLRMIPVVRTAVPQARFVIVGAALERERAYETGLRRLVDDLGIGNVVAFLGQRSDAVEIMSELAVYCLTSNREPFPRTVLEAQAVGCPVVASNTGGCPEMIEDGATGLLFSVTAGDAPQRLAAQVARLLRNREWAARLALQAHENLMRGIATLQPVREMEAHLGKLALSRNDDAGIAGSASPARSGNADDPF